MRNTLLVVCTANTCRSPLAVAAFDHALVRHDFRTRITLRSRGEDAEPGRPVCEQVLHTARRHGLDTRLVEGHVATPLDLDELTAASLVLAADRGVRAKVLKLDPRLAGRTFTVREATALSRLVAADDLSDPRADRGLDGFAAALNDNRGLTGLPATERSLALPWRRLAVHAHDVPDAHLEARVSHRLVYRTLVPAVEELVVRLAAFATVRQG